MKAKAVSIFSTTMLLITMMLSVACQRSESPLNADPAQPLYLGNLDQKANEIFNEKNKKFMSVCDYQWRDKALEISRVLEEKRDAIEAMAKDNLNSDTEKIIDYGSFKFVDDSATPAGPDTWTESVSSWSRIAKIYDWVKDDPQDSRWLTLNRLVRSIVVDDERRVINGNFYGLSRLAEPMILEIDRKASACKKIESCVNPNLTEAEENFLKVHPFYIRAIRTFKGDKYTFQQKREYVGYFTSNLHQLAERYGFFNESLLKVTGNTITVPMNLSALGDEGAHRFVEFIEKTWNTDPNYSIKIERVTDSSSGYAVQVDEVVGARARVNSNTRVMELHNWGRIKTIGHEFGHILGFRDNYFTSWNIDTCSYTMESNTGDLMSNSSEGIVLARHWSKLKEIYWPALKVERQRSDNRNRH